MTQPLKPAWRLTAPLGFVAVIAFMGGAALADSPSATNRQIINALTARGFHDIEIDRTGSVVRVDAERQGIDYDFVYNPSSGKLTVRGDNDGRIPHQDAKRSRVVQLLQREGFSGIRIRETGAVVRGDATRGGFEYDFLYNPASGKLTVERDHSANAGASAKPGNQGLTGQARAQQVRASNGNNGRGNGKGNNGHGNGG